MTDPIADLDCRLCDYRRNPLGAIAMNSAPTIRARELEIQRLKADVAEVVKALADLLSALDMEPDYLIAKQGA